MGGVQHALWTPPVIKNIPVQEGSPRHTCNTTSAPVCMRLRGTSGSHADTDTDTDTDTGPLPPPVWCAPQGENSVATRQHVISSKCD